MTSPYTQFETDAALETEGVVLDYGEFRIRIARAGGANKKFAKVLEAKLKPYRRQIANDTLDEEVARRIQIEAYADAIVLGWDDMKGRDGKPLAFSRDNCIRLFNDLPDLFADVREQSAKVALFRREEIEEAAGNSPRG